MKKIIFICFCLCYVINIGAKDHVYRTKLYGDLVFNDVTKKVTFKGNTYSVYKSESTEDGFKMFCLLNSKRRLFEFYSSGENTYLIKYKDKSEKVSNNKKGATLYYEGIGEISADDITSNIARNKERYLSETGITNSNDKIEVLNRVSDIIRLIKKGGLKVNSSGTYSFNDPEFNHLQSTGEFKKKTFGGYKKDNNYYNNLAFNIIGQAIKDSRSYTIDSGYTPEEQQRIQDFRDGKIDWEQISKTEIISYNVQ